jgi:selenocysteine-specific elongation factor
MLTTASPGRRLAVNLTGVAHGDVRRGDALVKRSQWEPTTTFDASLTVLASVGHDVSRRGAYAVHLGSGEHPSALRVLGSAALPPGSVGFVRVHLPVALPLVPGDHYVLRESGRGETVGGGEVLDVAPRLPAARARPSRSVDRVVAEWGWIEADRLERLTGERRAPTVGGWVVDASVREEAEAVLRAVVADGGLDVARLSAQDRALLAAMPDVVVEGGRARLAAAAPAVASSHP